MPYQSKAQAAYVHAKAAEGVPWAKKFVAHSHGQKVSKLPKRAGQYTLKRGKR